MITTTVESPLGPLRVYAEGGAIVGLYLPDHQGAPRPEATPAPDDPLLREASRQLADYFAGRRQRFDLPLAPRGTPFQRSVWAALQAIPLGARVSYGMLAQSIGRPTAVRAVGAANGRNPIAILVPCHRVVSADGKLTGYAGGLEAKRWLLTHEARDQAR